MAKNKNGQTVNNKKYYKNKNNNNNNNNNKNNKNKPNNNASNHKKKKKKNNKPKNQQKRLENNVSIIVDDKKEALNYSIIDSTDHVEIDGVSVDYRTKKVNSSRKIKTNFKEEKDVLDRFIFVEDDIDKAKKKKKKKKKEQVQEQIEVKEQVNVEEPIAVEVPKEEAAEEKEIVDKAFENSEIDTGDIDRPAIFKNISTEKEPFRAFLTKLFVLLIILILSIFFVINFFSKYMSSTTTEDVGYFESSEVNYKLCSNGKCDTTNVIKKNIDTVNIGFIYSLSFDEKINFSGKYNVVAKFSISDDKTGNVLYSDKKEINKNKFSKKNIQEFEIKEDSVVLLEDYRKYLEKYNSDRQAHYNGEVRVNLYVDGVNGKKRVCSLLIPLQDNQQVEETVISYQAGDASIEDDGSYYGKVYVYLIIISLVLVIASSIGVVLLLTGVEEEDE